MPWGDAIATKSKEMILIDNEDWDGIRNEIENYSNHGHLPNAEFFLRCLLSCDENEDDFFQYEGVPSDTRMDIIQRLFDKRREIREKEMKNGLKYSSYETEDFCLQIQVCCGNGTLNPNCEVELYLTNYIVDLVLREHNALFQSSFRDINEFEKCKRDMICKVWEKTCIGNFVRSIESFDDLRKRNFRSRRGSRISRWEMTEKFMLHQRTDSLPLLHHAVKHGYPFFIVWLISRLYPEQIYERDCTGRIPLHYSFQKHHVWFLRKFIGTFNERNNIISYESHPEYTEEEGEIFGTRVWFNGDRIWVMGSEFTVPHYLIARYPAGAGIADPDGKLPLAMCLEKVRDGWNKEDDKNKESMLSCMNRLIHSEPKALATRDMVSHLFPFMIPSIQPGEDGTGTEQNEIGKKKSRRGRRRRRSRDTNDTNDYILTFTYDILRKDPTVLKIFVDPDRSFDSYRVRSLRQNVENLQTKLLAANAINRKQQNEIIQLTERIKRLQPDSTDAKPIDHYGIFATTADDTHLLENSPEKKRAKLA